MIVEKGSGPRALRTDEIRSDLVVVGGGLSGVCAAVAAAREGLKVTLVQDRPVLGGNASSEVRLWVLGATSHGGNNNRWAREGGVINEILTRNQLQNADGNPLIVDIILRDLIANESNITLLLNTSVYSSDVIESEVKTIRAFNSQNSTCYVLSAPLFVDSSGDGILAFTAGAAFRMGAEEAEEFNEPLAPGDEYGKLLGHSLYFYTKDVGHPVNFVAPSFALKDIPSLIPRYRNFKTSDQGCSLWWIEWGGRLDTIHESEDIKFELQKIVYGVWDYVKNSGSFPDAETMALEWVGTIPGKRESRRFEGDYMLSQKDIVEQIEHVDNISHGGWAIDLHPADGVYSDKGGCNQYHAKGVYGIPYRCMYSRNIKNLFINGRLISATHVAFGSTRVMATSSAIGQAIGTAASLCHEYNVLPQQIMQSELLDKLKHRLSRSNHFVPVYDALAADNLMTEAVINVSSELAMTGLASNEEWQILNNSYAQILPVTTGESANFDFNAKALTDSELVVEFRIASKSGNHTPDVLVDKQAFKVSKGLNELSIVLPVAEQDQYLFICFIKNTEVAIEQSDELVTGLLSVRSGGLEKVSTKQSQIAPPNSGIDSFDFWVPVRRPEGANLAFKLSQKSHLFKKENLIAGPLRPTSLPNAWVADRSDKTPSIECRWESGVSASRLFIYFDCDYDHPLESVQYRHHDRVSPYLVDEIDVLVNGEKFVSIRSNNDAFIQLDISQFEQIESLNLTFGNTRGNPISILGLRME